MHDILDLDRFPLNNLDSPEGRALIKRCKVDLDASGMFNLDGLVRNDALAACVTEIKPALDQDAYEHRQLHNIYFLKNVDGVPEDHPALKKSLTSNRKICADQMADTLLVRLYEWAPMARFLAAVMDKPELHVMKDPLARVNVMTYKDGEALNWHFDRSEFTTTLLLQAPKAGGEFQHRSGLRSDSDPNYAGVARLLNGDDNQVETVHLNAGTLNVFKGKNTAHRVTPVEGDRNRIIAVFSYYERPGVMFSEEDQIKFYGRTA